MRIAIQIDLNGPTTIKEALQKVALLLRQFVFQFSHFIKTGYRENDTNYTHKTDLSGKGDIVTFQVHSI